MKHVLNIATSLKEMNQKQPQRQDEIRLLKKQLNDTEQAFNRLLSAIESGLILPEDNIQERMHAHQSKRQRLKIELEGLQQSLKTKRIRISPNQIDYFCAFLKSS